ncbi:MAG TPA: sigma-70 family RNA polymerase sigma factor, partial [Polyangia bacterium]
MPKRPKPAAPTDAEVVEGELVDGDEPVEVEPSEPDSAELADEEVPADDALPPIADEDDEAPVDAAHALVPEPKAGRSLARLDPLQLYIQDIRRYPLLSREQEHELAKHFVETGDVEDARRLVTANLRLVVKIAHEYRRAHRNLLDLIQEGNVGLVQAVKKYDPYRGVKLSSYAAWWIRAYMLKFILSNWRLVKIGTTQAQRKLFFNLRKEREKLEQLAQEELRRIFKEKLGEFGKLLTSEKDRFLFEHRIAPPEGEEPMTLQ